MSFNWQDVASTATRQLNSQNYNICFRTELVSGQVYTFGFWPHQSISKCSSVTHFQIFGLSQRATQMCVSVCQVISGGDAFFVTTVAPAAVDNNAAQAATASTYSAVGTTNAAGTTAVCLYDFLLISGARDANGIEADRYCGGALNPAPLGGAAVLPLLNSVPLGGSPTSVQVCSKLDHF